mmetsp:Transcript_14330/g.26054  ORF Transcript_14330/g.26054 Transcript_14330/m.26054 type:complete len:217 (-) Transcript_14330:1298-1948(-)
MLMKDVELLLSAHARSLGDEETKLPQHIGCHAHSSFMASMGTNGHKQSRGRIPLKVSLGMIGHYLHHSMPHGITYIISTDGNQFEDCINIPPQVCCILFCEDGNLEHHFLSNTSICHDQVCHQLVHNSLCIVCITNDKQQVQCSTSYTDVSIFQRYQYSRLMFLRPLHTALNLSQFCHGHQSQVTNIGFTDRYELSKNLHCPLKHFQWTCCAPCYN